MTPYCEIPLAKGGFTLVDYADADLAKAHKWWLARGYAYTTINRRNYYLHRMILETPKGLYVDHANRDPLDNRRANLRVASQTQQNANSVRRKSKTGFRGVHFSGRTFHSYVECNGIKTRNYGFLTAEAAARDYDRLAFEKFGEFAILNFAVRQ